MKILLPDDLKSLLKKLSKPEVVAKLEAFSEGLPEPVTKFVKPDGTVISVKEYMDPIMKDAAALTDIHRVGDFFTDKALALFEIAVSEDTPETADKLTKEILEVVTREGITAPDALSGTFMAMYSLFVSNTAVLEHLLKGVLAGEFRAYAPDDDPGKGDKS